MHHSVLLINCSTPAIGANAEEAARKESYETVYWLRLAVRAGLVTERDVGWELDEAQQLKRMITRAVHTALTSTWRGSH